MVAQVTLSPGWSRKNLSPGGRPASREPIPGSGGFASGIAGSFLRTVWSRVTEARSEVKARRVARVVANKIGRVAAENIFCLSSFWQNHKARNSPNRVGRTPSTGQQKQQQYSSSVVGARRWSRGDRAETRTRIRRDSGTDQNRVPSAC